jgi:hypothetical protein
MTGNVFDYALEPNAGIEALRYIVFLTGVLVFCASLVRWLQHNRPWQAFSFMALGIFTSVQELTVLGEPFYPWRLFLLIVMTACALVSMYRDHVPLPLGEERRHVAG